jgi:hypothetical protein
MSEIDTRRLRIDRQQLLAAAERVGIAEEPAQALWAELAPAAAAGPPVRYAEAAALSRVVQTLLYVGVVTVIGAFGWWTKGAYDEWGYGGVLAFTLAFQAGFAGVSVAVVRRGYRDIGGVLLAVAVFAVPLAVYSVEHLFGVPFHRSYEDFYPWISQGWVVMELVSIGVGAAAFAWRRHSFLLLPVMLFTYFLAMDGTAHVVGEDLSTLGRVVGLYAAITFAAAVILDVRGLRTYAFWPHVFAMLGATWSIGALTEDPRGALIIAGALGIALGIWLGRVTYLVGGGICAWIGVSLLAPSPGTLILSGLGLIGVSIWLAMRGSPLRRWLETRTVPGPARQLKKRGQAPIFQDGFE